MSSVGAAYRLYGLTLQSSLGLPCPRANRTSKPDVCLQLGAAADFTRAHEEVGRSRDRKDWFQHQRLADGTTYLRWNGLFEFLVSACGRRIVYRPLEKTTPESFHVYLLGQVLSFSLVAIGVEPLHGTVVTVDGAAVAFLGDCGYGKSTLAAAFLTRGFRVVTDDLVVLQSREGEWRVHPGIPRLKLFPSVAHRLLGHHVAGIAMNSGTSKLVLPLGTAQSVTEAVPLKAMYVLSDPLQPRALNRRTRVHIDPLSGREAFLEVIRATFNLLVLERQRLANHFAFATRLTAGVPIRRVTYSRNLSGLSAVCDALVADLAACGTLPGVDRTVA